MAHYYYPPQFAKKPVSTLKGVVIAAVAALLGFIAVCLFAAWAHLGEHPVSDPVNSALQSYQIGYAEVGPIGAKYPFPQGHEVTCELSAGTWIAAWEDGGSPHDPVLHSQAPSWWDHDAVQHGCLDYLNGK